ncbi:MAG TPA: TIGR03086 family metal-binding protein [Acidimicrobiia bacterium]|jgi:uncharacterized protein (TIGR03086 family)|nr:TIGR03086 family metal-binding protein [Acidimicrobiia bacterium]
MAPADDYRRAGERTVAVIAGIQPHQMENRTPCDEWDVRALVSHLVNSNLWLAAAVEGEGAEWDERSGEDPEADYRASVAAVQSAMRIEGAMEKLVATGMGELPGAVLYTIAMTKQLLHGWDLAVATGQATTLDPELVTAADAFIRPAVESGAAAEAYAPPLSVEEGASAQEKLLALVGRTPVT